MKQYTLLAVSVALSFGICACDSDNSGSDNSKTGYELACTQSGGAFADGVCSCGESACGAGIVCVSGACAVTPSPNVPQTDGYKLACTQSGGTFANGVCSCGESACGAGIVCVDGACGVTPIPGIPQTDGYKLACSESGGIFADGVCSCGESACGAGIVCVNGACAATPSPGGHQTDGYELACTQSGGTFADGVCSCGESACGAGIVCVDGACAETSLTDAEIFDRACSISGGHADNGICVCNNTPCASGILCNATTKECAYKPECEGAVTECIDQDGVGQIRSCIGGSWAQFAVCPGGAVCADETKCVNLSTEPCTKDGENVCSNGKLKQCIAKQYSAEKDCDNSNGCKDEKTCGECSYTSSTDLEKVCTDNDNGCSYKQCTSKYTWSNADDYDDLSCINASELGVCRNGYYKLTKGDSTKDAVIQTCQNGTWPLAESGSATDWINHEQNDALFRFAMTCNKASGSGSEIHLYSNFTKDVYTATSTSFNCDSLKSDTASFRLSKSNIIFNEASGSGYQFLDNLLQAIYGYPTFDNATWFIKDGIFQWFNCFNRNCSSTSICIDVLGLKDSTQNLSPNPYIFTVIDERYTEQPNPGVTYMFEKAKGECNSNRTGIHGAEKCDVHAIDMLHRLESDKSSEACSTDPICLKEKLDFNICRFGASRSVSCKTNASDQYVCTFNTPDTSFDSETVCVDFYDKANHHYAYKFTADVTNKANAAITKCSTNRCNRNWTGCSDDPEVVK